MKSVDEIRRAVEEKRRKREELAMRISEFLKANSHWAYTVEELYDKFPEAFEYTPFGRIIVKLSMIGPLERYGVRIASVNGWTYLYYGGVER